VPRIYGGVTSPEELIRLGEVARKYNVPVWLLRQYNPDLNFDRIQAGAVVRFPRLKAIAAGNAVSVTTPQVLADTH